MPRFQRYGFPFQYYRPQYYRPYSPTFNQVTYHEVTPPEPSLPPPSKQKHPSETVWFDLFGIKLFFDDVLILSLLFFLYKEEVKDEGLFLALVLLLIS